MPTYQYACTACDHRFETVQSFTDDPLTQCPACDGRLRKLFGSVGVVFKGSGFYRTDSRAAANDNGAGSKDDASGKDAGSKDTGSKDTSGKDTGSKDSGSKDTGGGNGSGEKKSDTGSKEKAATGSSSSGTSAGSS